MPPHRGELVAREGLTGEDKILFALERLTNEVLFVRRTLLPLSRWQLIAIVAGSAFLGGVFTNLVLWLLGLGTMYGLAGFGGHHP